MENKSTIEAISELKAHLSFRMKDKTYPNTHVGIEYDLTEIQESNDDQIHLYGYIITANWKGYVDKYATIICVFGEEGKEGSPFRNKYYLVEQFGKTIKKTPIELLGDPDNEIVMRKIISIIYPQQ